MKNYKSPEVELLKLTTNDIIMESKEDPQPTSPVIDSIGSPNQSEALPMF